MGLLSSLGALVNPTALIGSAGSAGGAVLGYLGQKDTNEANQQMAHEGRAWQSEMRSTAYQATVEDMKKAGLNPMLAYQQGPTQAPGTSVPTMGNKMQAAVSSSAAAANIANTIANTRKTEADTDLSRATAAKTVAETGVATNSAANIAQNTLNLQEAAKQIQQNVQLQKEQTQSEVVKRTLNRSQADLNDVIRLVEEKKISLVEAQTRLSKITGDLSQLEIPRAANKAAVQDSWWMRNVSPYLGDIDKATNSANKILNITR